LIYLDEYNAVVVYKCEGYGLSQLPSHLGYCCLRISNESGHDQGRKKHSFPKFFLYSREISEPVVSRHEYINATIGGGNTSKIALITLQRAEEGTDANEGVWEKPLGR
jgi:hypothetical protein